MLDDRNAAAEATIRLCHFQADIPAAEHDQMLRHIVEFQSLDVGKRPGRIEAGYSRNGRVCSDVEKNLIARQHARPAVVQTHLERFRRHEIPCSHDQFRAARLVLLQMYGDQAFDHVALALTDFGHVDRDGTRVRAEVCSVMHQVGDLRAPDLVLAGEAVDVRARAANPTALHHGGPSPRARHVPGQIHAAISTAKDKGFNPFWLRHGYLLSRVISLCLVESETLRTSCFSK
jgi:hypothetical protein